MAEMLAPFALFAALVLGTAAAHKIVESERLARAAASLTGLPMSCGVVLSIGAAAVESSTAVALVFPASRQIAAGAAATLWTLYAVLLVRAEHKGLTLDCGCTLSKKNRDKMPLPYVRAVALAALVGVVALVPARIGLQSLDAVSGLAIFSLYLAADELIAVRVLRRRVIA